ncbi:LTA synthase family protein [Hymenobacter sp. BT18]|uniref:LTA synthase family protein n=1 Tax=Hymenobacter sp. BT18 TaxID=2835648 RepID=UPI00143E4BC3|nr:LTA synthase family protein [Hymenobacter sp. BT18]QIX62952.1 LTA synthase family protein [Hymenobacter sp. BT18]
MLSEHLRLLLRRFALLLGTYLLLRVGFYLANQAVFQAAAPAQVLLAFWHGFRFDVSALLLLNLLWVVLSLVPSLARGWQQLLRLLYLVLNALGLMVNLADWEYFKFIGRRTSNELTTIGDDVQRQAGQLLANYWYLFVPFFLLLGALWYFYPMPKTTAMHQAGQTRKVWLRWGVEALLVAGLAVVGIRGGLQLKPLRTGAAFAQQPAILGHLALNSTFTFLKSLGYTTIEPKAYFASDEELQQALAARRVATHPPPARRDNVVILLLESFASEYTGVENSGQGYTPFFDSLATHGGLLFRDHYANGRRSIEALPAVLAGLPSLLEGPFITSNFQTNELHGLGEILGQQGYTTSVFHGAENGSMGFNTFAGVAGIQRYYGLNEYPGSRNSPDFDGHWGIFDEPYLQYFSRELSRQPEPFFSTLFTLSAHEPFTVPSQYAGRFPKGTLPIHRAVAYADFALRQFFKTAARQPWYSRTLFVLLADHTSQTDRRGYQNLLGAYKTPLLLFRPGQALSAPTSPRITQQADVPATVLDWLGIRAPRQLLPFGYSAFDSASTGRALFLSNGSYYLVHHDYVTELTADDQVHQYAYQRHQLPTHPVAVPDTQKLRQYGQELRACVQFYVNGLVQNRLYPKPARARARLFAPPGGSG